MPAKFSGFASFSCLLVDKKFCNCNSPLKLFRREGRSGLVKMSGGPDRYGPVHRDRRCVRGTRIVYTDETPLAVVEFSAISAAHELLM